MLPNDLKSCSEMSLSLLTVNCCYLPNLLLVSQILSKKSYNTWPSAKNMHPERSLLALSRIENNGWQKVNFSISQNFLSHREKCNGRWGNINLLRNDYFANVFYPIPCFSQSRLAVKFTFLEVQKKGLRAVHPVSELPRNGDYEKQY